MLKKIRQYVRDRQAFEYHKRHKKNVLQNITLIIKNQGKTLTPSLKNKCDEYAVEVFKHILFSPDLYLYSLMHGEFKEGFIPSNFYKSVVAPQLSGNYTQIANLRLLESLIFTDKHIPTIGYYARGFFYNKNNEVVSNNEIEKKIFKSNSKVLFKLDTSFRGKGVYVYSTENFNPNEIRSLGTGIFQPYIKQHDFFNQFNTNSVATIRITTTNDSCGKIKINGAYLRLSLKRDEIVRSDNSIRIPIDVTDGKLFETGLDSDWNICKKHPNSTVLFKNKIIPLFDKCKEVVQILHNKIPFVKCIGWDLIVDKNEEVVIMEWNAVGNDIDYHEISNGPCFQDLKWEKLALPKLVTPYQKGSY